MFLNNQKGSAGFTMIEMIAALFVVNLGIMAVFSLLTQSITYINTTASSLTATYLAQEGIEIVRNIRDTNLLEQQYKSPESPDIPWNDGLTGCVDGCEGDYTSSFLFAFTDQKLKIDGGFYKYSIFGTETPFRRKITIFDAVDLDDPPDGIIDKMEVLVEVLWTERGKNHNVSVQETLYRWY